MMEKKEFLSICDSALKEMGFSKKGGAYYLNIGSDLVGAVFFRKSNFGQFIMSNAELRYKDIMKHSHFPSIMMLTYQLVSNFL